MSEFRQDLVSGDWIIIAPGRAARPDELAKKQKVRKPAPKNGCPFEDLRKSGNWPLILSYPERATNRNWRVVLAQNKFPALRHERQCAVSFAHGPYTLKTGIGHHNIVVTRDHYKNFADLNSRDAVGVFQIIQEQYKLAEKDGCSMYVSGFCNWGPSAGATVYHPHYQVLILPVIPPHIENSLRGGERYFKRHGRCVRCVMLANDLKEKSRVIEENKFAAAVVPFAAKEPFEIRILPKKHLPYFTKTPLADLRGVAALLQSSLRRVKKYLHDPDFNFFVHGAPLDNKNYEYHHWHVEIIPKISTPGGFELSTGIDINIVAPEMAARILRGGQ